MKLINILFKFFYKEEKFNIILAVILSLITNIFKINIISYITSNIIKAIEKNNIKYAYDYYKYLIIAIIFFIILCYYLKEINNKLLVKVRNWSRLFLLKNIYYNSNENLSNINYSKLNSPLFRFTTVIQFLLMIILNQIIPYIGLIFVIFLFFIYKNYEIGLIFLIGNIIFLIYLYNNFNILINKYNSFEKKIINNEAMINENLNNFSKIILRGKKNDELNILDNDTNYIYKSGGKFYKIMNNTLLISNIIIYLLLIIIIGYLIYLYSKKKISNIIFITFITILLLYRDLILNLLDTLPNLTEIISRSIVIESSFDKNLFYNLFNNTEKKIYKPNSIEFNNIEFNNINFKYEGESIKLFNNLNLKINTENKIIGLTGLSGNGKSTIIKLLLKLYPYEGTILIDGINVKEIDTNYLRKSILYVDQSSNLFDKKIIENINYGVDSENDSILSKQYYNEIMKYSTIKQLYLYIDIENKNAGFNGGNISGGQRQVINLINGLITPSLITVLDEPTNALDPALKKDVIQNIKEFKKYNKCIIIITHDKDLYEIFDENIII